MFFMIGKMIMKEKNSNIKNVNDNMDNNKYNNAYDEIMELYQNLSYLDIYSPFIAIFILITFCVIFLLIYLYIKENIKPIKDNWETERCKPYVIPFAGMVNLPEGENGLEFTAENFTYCVQNIIKNVSGSVLDPVNYIVFALTEVFSLLADVLNTIRGIISSIRTDFTNIVLYIYDKIANFIIRIEQMFIKIMDIFGRLGGILTVMNFTGESILLIFESFSSLSLKAAVNFLIVVTVLISLYTLMIIASLGTASGALMPLIVILLAAYTAIALPTGTYINFMTNVLHYNTGLSVPTCFDKNTIIQKLNGEEVYISDIKVGDILKDNSVVQSFFELIKMTEPMYLLDDIKVSGTHRVLHEDKWILVSKHPSSQIIKDYNEKILYCLNTSTKTIKIKNTIFSDWDDINLDDKYKDLTEKENIHSYYDKGFPSNTEIKTLEGNIKKIKDIQLGEVLEPINNNKIVVYGKVVIKSDDLIDGNLLDSETKDLGNYYHLLTNQGKMIVNNTIYRDFNFCIDKYLS